MTYTGLYCSGMEWNSSEFNYILSFIRGGCVVEWFRYGTPTRAARDRFPVPGMHNLTDYKLVESVPRSLNVNCVRITAAKLPVIDPRVRSLLLEC